MGSAARVSSKGQITIPAWAREALGIGPGSLVQLRLDDGRLVLERVDRSLDEIQGSLRDLYDQAGGVDAVLEEIREGRRDRSSIE